MKKIVLSWSTGKDSAWALNCLKTEDSYQIAGLLTTVTRDYERVSMHGVRESLLEWQAAQLNLKLYKVYIPATCVNADYQNQMSLAVQQMLADGISAVAFGDLYLEDIRAYREKMLASTGLEAIFPLWGMPTAELARTMVSGGLRAVITCVDTRVLPRSVSGSVFDLDFIENLPPEIDPCGENGEFHSLCYQAPIFPKKLSFKVGEQSLSGDFCFTDVKVVGLES